MRLYVSNTSEKGYALALLHSMSETILEHSLHAKELENKLN